MHARTIAAATALLAAGAAGAAEPGTSRWLVDARAGVSAGAFDGMGVRTDSGGLLLAEAALTPERKAQGFTLTIPLRVQHRQTVGATLSETTGSLAVEPSWKIAHKTDLGLEAGASGAWRPDWPDLYQRAADGSMPGTDRYGYVAWRAGASVWTRPAAGQHLRLRYRYVNTTYREDPAFDPATPMHLTPRDNGQHELTASWRIVREGYAVGARVAYDHRQDFTLLARDAGTGSTTGNPKQQLDDVEPSIQLELKRLGDKADVTLEYGYQVQRDAFQGYYSYQGHHPALRVSYAFTEKLEGGLRLEGWFRSYGPDSKASTQDGRRLRDDKGLVRGELAYALGGGLALTGRAEWVDRSTNYPDYVPGVYPATRFYDIRWDYTNLSALVGVEWRNR